MQAIFPFIKGTYLKYEAYVAELYHGSCVKLWRNVQDIKLTEEGLSSTLAETRRLIDNDLYAPETDEESRCRHALLQLHLYDVDWLEAITLMRQSRCRGRYAIDYQV